MSKRLTGILLIIAGIAAFHLLGSQPETNPLWYNQISAKIYSDPVSAGDRYVFLGGDKGKREFKLFEFDAQGKLSAESLQMSFLPYSPIVVGNMVVVGDSARVVRGFSVPGLKLEWESGTVEPIKIPPVKLDNENFLVQSDAHTLFCLNSKTGKPVWDKIFSDSLVNFAAGRVIVCIHGYDDLKTPKWKASALNPEDGSTVWTINLSLSQDTPLFVQNVCVLASSEGEILIADQESGSVLHRHPVKGMKAVQILDETLIMLASGGSRVICMSLMTGNSWSTTMQSGFIGAAKFGERLMLIDKKNLRCLDVTTGSQLWRRELEDVYNAFPHRNGIFTTHKDSFFSRQTYGSYIGTESGRNIWMASSRGLFMKPLPTSYGDLLVSYEGSIRMMPKPAGSEVTPTKTATPTQVLDPTADNINFWKENNASATTAAASASVAAPQEEAASESPSEEIDGQVKDDGWLKKD